MSELIEFVIATAKSKGTPADKARAIVNQMTVGGHVVISPQALREVLQAVIEEAQAKRQRAKAEQKKCNLCSRIIGVRGGRFVRHRENKGIEGDCPGSGLGA